MADITLEIANKTKKIPKNVCFHLKQKMQRTNGILKKWAFEVMFNKNNRIVYMLQLISLYNSSKTFHIPYLYTYTTRIAQKLVRGQYHLPGETTHRTNSQISHILKNMSDMVLGQLTVYCFKMADGCLDLRLVSPGSN